MLRRADGFGIWEKRQVHVREGVEYFPKEKQQRKRARNK